MIKGVPPAEVTIATSTLGCHEPRRWSRNSSAFGDNDSDWRIGFLDVDGHVAEVMNELSWAARLNDNSRP
jgi:hypothetical protein